MAFVNKNERKQTIDLTGPGGNAYALLGIASRFAEQLREAGAATKGLEPFDPERIREEMQAGDYEQLLTVFNYYFGDFIDLER